jgi:hypothetical protein
MNRLAEGASQFYIDRMVPKGIFYFYTGAWVNTGSHVGYLTDQVMARITNRKMRTGPRRTDQLTMYESLTAGEIYFDKNRYPLPVGTLFSVHQKDRHREVQKTL